MTKVSDGNDSKNFDADGVIVDMLALEKKEDFTKKCSSTRIIKLIEAARKSFEKQLSMIEIESPLNICGDIHGQYGDLLRLFERGAFPPIANYLFLGDYVDRGMFSTETIVLLLAYKVKFPNNFFLLRGNHECAVINKVYGFYSEVTKKFEDDRGAEMWILFQRCFGHMPLTALVAGRILCMHGGISENVTNLNDLRQIKKPQFDITGDLELDLLWADPDETISGYDESTRGCGKVFGNEALKEFMTKFGIELVVRAHQVVQDGYEFFAGKRLVTVFSAPHYCGEFNNSAAIMSISKQLVITFQVLKPVKMKTDSEKARDKAKLKEKMAQIAKERGHVGQTAKK